ncbi:MAG: radical SAM family heme chaperone HemW [Cellvibrionaceae bacterium]|nr:radical SAM family heme chaperone HemW [Cellvibrionaceae bacterium]
MILPPLSLYVHIPWCVRKCPYCDFNSHETQTIPEAEYVAALLQDLEQDLHLIQGRRLRSIFFGGGTPSLFKAASIAKILDAVEQKIGLENNAEITLETNPGTAEYDNLEGYRSAGVNRLSFGIQSFNDQHLQKLGRIHDSREALTAYASARRAGFQNINLDLMHGLPGQIPEEARSDLQQAIALQPEHISWYQLTIEPNTVFYSRPPALPEDETLSDIQDAGQELLQQAGFAQYEVSAYCRPERQSQHNLNYWQFGDYLALGAGAHGKITIPEKGIMRYRKTRKPADYLDPIKPFTAGWEYVEKEQQTLEFMMNALRLVDGVPRHWFAERTQMEDAALQHYLPQLVERGLLAARHDRLQPTSLGLRFLNDTLAAFDA